MKILKTLWRAFIIMARDMFIGLLGGLCASVLLYKINPKTINVVALLIPAGLCAGIFKGISKFLILNFFSSLPSKGYRYNYPKYKILFLWVIIYLSTFIYCFGFNVYLWITAPLMLLNKNMILPPLSSVLWGVLFAVGGIAGISAHFYEPPHNEDESVTDDEIIKDEGK
jgi:hypothetical protein